MPAEPTSVQLGLDLIPDGVMPPVDLASGGLLSWYDSVKRDLPWRLSRDPYAIWVSEIMLQQTQVATVIPYWNRWMTRFPTVEALAAADEQEMLSLWQGLGYYRRGRMLLAGARWIVAHGFPRSAEEWLKVPGVGAYTAGAISSIALGEAVPVVDGNVERVYARLNGSFASGPSLNREAWNWAAVALHLGRPGDWNQALMELGATVCRPRDPACDVCPLAGDCVAFRTFRVGELPVAAVKRETVGLEFWLGVAVCGERFGLRQIPAGEWWEGMWEFPRFESHEGLSEFLDLATFEEVGEVRHSVTHHRIRMHVLLARMKTPCSELRWFSREELEQLPLPSAQRKALKLVLG